MQLDFYAGNFLLFVIQLLLFAIPTIYFSKRALIDYRKLKTSNGDNLEPSEQLRLINRIKSSIIITSIVVLVSAIGFKYVVITSKSSIKTSEYNAQSFKRQTENVPDKVTVNQETFEETLKKNQDRSRSAYEELSTDATETKEKKDETNN